jgi:hypothetical protein
LVANACRVGVRTARKAVVVALLALAGCALLPSCTAKPNGSDGKPPAADADDDDAEGSLELSTVGRKATLWSIEMIADGCCPFLFAGTGLDVGVVFVPQDGEIAFFSRTEVRWAPAATALLGRVPSAAVARGGLLAVAYMDDDRNLWYAALDGDAWKEEPVVWLDERDGPYSLSVQGEDLSMVAFRYYREGYDPEGNFYADEELRVASRDGEGAWQIETAAGGVSMGVSPGFANTILVDDSGVAHVAHVDAAHQSLLYTTNKLGTWGSEAIGPAVESGQQALKLSIDGQSAPRVCFSSLAQEPRRDMQLWYGVKPGQEWQTELVVGPGANWDCFMATNTDGRDFVTFHDRARGILKWAWKPDKEWRIGLLGGTSGASSIALDDDGYVHIAFERDGSIWHAVSPEPYGAPE